MTNSTPKSTLHEREGPTTTATNNLSTRAQEPTPRRRFRLPRPRRPGSLLALVAGLGTLAVGYSTFAVVEPGQRGVYVLFGVASPDALPPGLHWKHPLAEVIKVNVRQVVFDQASEASSADLQTVHTRIAVNYRPIPERVPKLFKDVGLDNPAWENVLLRPAIQEVTKAVTAKFSAESLIQRREQAKALITDTIVERLRHENLDVTEVSVTDFGFNQAFNIAIEAKQIAEQKAKQAKNELDRVAIEAEQRVVQAEASKKARILAAEAQSREILILADAEAAYHERIAASGNELALRLRLLEKWNGTLPTTVASEHPALELALR